VTNATGQAYALALIKDSRHRSARAARDVADWLGWLEVDNKAARTIDAYERTVATLLREFPDTPLGEFTSGDILHVLRRFPPKSRHIRRVQLNQFFQWAELTERVDKSPMRQVPKIKPPPHQVKAVFNEAEVALLEGLPMPDGPLMSILLRTGIRLSEATHLQAGHVDFANQQIVIYKGKGGRDRVIPIRALLPILDDWFTLDGINPEDFLWYTTPAGWRVRRSSPVSSGAFYLWWRRCLTDAGVRSGKRSVHSTRRTFATNWARKGGQPERLKKVMGHKSIQTTMDYYVDALTEELMDDLAMVEA
jgi:integrase